MPDPTPASDVPRTARPVKWITMVVLGSYVARTWRGDIVARPMNADGSMSPDECEESLVEPGSEYYEQIRAHLVAETGDFPRPPEDPASPAHPVRRTIDWAIIPGARPRIMAKCTACGGDNGTDYPHPYPWACVHCGMQIILAQLTTVGELRRALVPFANDQIVVLDVDLAKCHSDRNVMHIEGVRADDVVDGAAPWVFIDAGDHAKP